MPPQFQRGEGMTEKYLYIMQGISGSGKTWLADLLQKAQLFKPGRSRMICADDYFYDSSGLYDWDGSKLGEAHEWCRDEVDFTMRKGINEIIVHNTCAKQWEADPYLKLAKEHGYIPVVISISVPFDVALERNKKRPVGRRVPPVTMQRQLDNMERIELK